MTAFIEHTNHQKGKTMYINNPLTPMEMKELDTFLQSIATPIECMHLSTLDGFLSAVAVGPTTATLEELLPTIFGETERDPMAWGSFEQADYVVKLIERHFNNIRSQLQRAPEKFKPYLYKDLRDGNIVRFFWYWCHGFMRHVEMECTAWAPIFQDQEKFQFVASIRYYSGTRAHCDLHSGQDFGKKSGKVARLLSRCIKEIKGYWDARDGWSQTGSHIARSQLGRDY